MLKEKVRSSLGRDLGVTTHLMRSVFDAELKKVSNLSSLQVILLMMVSVDKVTPRDTAMREMGVYGDTFDDIVTPLVDEGYLIDEDIALEITDKGESAVAKLWPIHEKTEDLLREGISEDDQENLKQMLKRMQKNAISILRNRK